MDKAKFKIVIPARYASSRLPGKPLREIAGKPMIQHTYERARQSRAEEVLIATDDQRIADTIVKFTDSVVLTSPDHASGTERLAEVVEQQQWDEQTIIVNVQGDEPLVSPEHIELVAAALDENPQAGMATLATPLELDAEVFDPNIVKVVMDVQGNAMYFSRAAIPWDRDSFSNEMAHTLTELPRNPQFKTPGWYRHIGMYAYRAGTLKQYMDMTPCMLEQTESLEQLRILYHGIKIHVSIVHDQPGHGVDVEADIAKVEQFLKQ